MIQIFVFAASLFLASSDRACAFTLPGSCGRTTFAASTSPLFHSPVVREVPELQPCHSRTPSKMLAVLSPVSPRSKHRLRNWVRLFRRNLKMFRRRMAAIVVALAFVLLSHTGVAHAVSAGRAGGSFGKSSRSPPISRSAPKRTNYYRPRYSSPIVITSGPSIYTNSYGYAIRRADRGMSPAEIAVLATVGSVMVYGFVNSKEYRRNSDSSSPHGPGSTSASLTVALNVPRRNDSSNILRALQRLADRADTSTRKGVQDLLSDGTCKGR